MNNTPEPTNAELAAIEREEEVDMLLALVRAVRRLLAATAA